MTPLKLLEQVFSELEKHSGHFAIAGGLAASFYRVKPRVTNDVDIALFVDDVEKSKETATCIIKAIGYHPAFGWISGMNEAAGDPIALVIGRKDKHELESTIDFLLPTLPWVEKAVERGQHSVIDFGFARLPTITPEDLILAKAFALMLEPNRYQDLDDIQSILKADNQLDIVYLVNEFERLKLSLPTALMELAPKALKRVVKNRI